MKRLILSLAAVAAVAGPMAATATPSHAQGYYRDHWEHRDHRGPDRYDRRDWDRVRHNGYYYGNPYYRPGYNQWRRGAPLPAYYRGAPVYDHGRYRLRQPPRGYAWYRAGDDYILAAIATGIIFEIINSN